MQEDQPPQIHVCLYTSLLYSCSHCCCKLINFTFQIFLPLMKRLLVSYLILIRLSTLIWLG